MRLSLALSRHAVRGACASVRADGVDDERVASPSADRMAVPSRDELVLGRMSAAVGVDAARNAARLAQDHDLAGRLSSWIGKMPISHMWKTGPPGVQAVKLAWSARRRDSAAPAGSERRILRPRRIRPRCGARRVVEGADRHPDAREFALGRRRCACRGRRLARVVAGRFRHSTAARDEQPRRERQRDAQFPGSRRRTHVRHAAQRLQ